MIKRSLLAVPVTVIVMLCAGYAVGQEVAEESAVEDPIIAIVNDYEIKSSDISTLVSQLPLGEQISIRTDPEKFAESLVQEEVVFQFALSNGFAEEPELREQIKTTVVNYLIDKHVTQKLVISDEAIKEFYDANEGAIRGETVEVRQILTKTRQECESVLERLNNNESFADLAAQYSIHENSAQNGGVVGSLMNHDGPLGFEQELFEIPQDTPTLFDSEEGCHLLIVSDHVQPPLPPLENVSSGIEGLLRRELEIEVLQSFMERANERVTVVRP